MPNSPCNATGSDWQRHWIFHVSARNRDLICINIFHSPSARFVTVLLRKKSVFLHHSHTEQRLLYSPVRYLKVLGWAQIIAKSSVTELKVTVKYIGMSLFCILIWREHERSLGFSFWIFSAVVSLHKGFKCCCFCDSKNYLFSPFPNETGI